MAIWNKREEKVPCQPLFERHEWMKCGFWLQNSMIIIVIAAFIIILWKFHALLADKETKLKLHLQIYILVACIQTLYRLFVRWLHNYVLFRVTQSSSEDNNNIRTLVRTIKWNFAAKKRNARNKWRDFIWRVMRTCRCIPIPFLSDIVFQPSNRHLICSILK